MNRSEEELDLLMQRVEQRERTTRQRVILYTLVPILLAGTLLWFTTDRILRARQELAAINHDLEAAKNVADHYREEVSRYEKELDELRKNLEEMEERLRQSANFVKHVFQIDWEITKVLASEYPRQSDVLLFIRELQDRGIGWRLGGTLPQEGFDSPRFAAYVLEQQDLLTVPPSERYRLREIIMPVEEPGVGDLIFYEAGYTMFYFRDEREHPFCVGMTPVGIVVLEVEFGPRILGYGKVNY